MNTLALLLAVTFVATGSAHAEGLEFAFDGESRARYESLDGQFRAGATGNDQLLLFRSLAHATATVGSTTFGLELQDSRTYMGDSETPLSSSFTDPLDVLQLYLRFDRLPKLLGADSSSELIVGRQTVSILSKRQIERVDYANVIKSYTGAHLISRNERGDELHLFHVVPTARFPNERNDVDHNRMHGNREQWNRNLFGIHYRKANLFAPIPGLAGELFVYGLKEHDSNTFQTPNRDYLSPGFRLHRRAEAGHWDLDIEAAYRIGSRRESSSPLDRIDLDVGAWMLLARVGYTFDTAWTPRIALQYYGTSGDRNPDDHRFDQFERMFGGRRGDLNNTSIHGPLTPANLAAIGLRFDVKPSERWDARLHYSASYLESARDRWIIAKVHDPTGQSGKFLGHAIDGRVRYWIAPDRLQLELGASSLIYGEFARNAPNGPDGSRTLFGYTQFTVFF